MSARAGRPRKTAETPVKAVEEVKENVKEDVKEAVEAVKTAVDEVKEEIKTEVKEEVKKTPARRGRKSAAEKAAEKAEVKTPAREKVAEKVEDVAVKKNVVLQFDFGEYVSEEIVESCIKAYQAENRAKVKSIDVYVKPADMKAYYVVNGKSAGSVDL